MNKIRDGETILETDRSIRFFQKNAEWFLNTREGFELGPFKNKKDTEQALSDYVAFVSTADAKTLETFYKTLVV